jgi:hypothetical protein
MKIIESLLVFGWICFITAAAIFVALWVGSKIRWKK